MRPPLARRDALAGAALLALALAPAIAQDLVRQEDAVVALFSLRTDLEVDAKLLVRLEERHDASVRDRDEAAKRVVRLYADLDALIAQHRAAARSRPGSVQGPQDGEGGGETAASGRTPEAIETEIGEKERELLAAERAEAAARDEGRRLREEMRLLSVRMDLLTQHIATLIAGLPSPRDQVTGIWDLAMMPGGEKGVFALFQSGTIVTGQYVLDGPFRGSLDGTLVDRKILLHRIDSRLGRSMDFSGFLSADGEAIRGTWENYDLSNGQPRTGSWSARRRKARPAEHEGAARDERGP